MAVLNLWVVAALEGWTIVITAGLIFAVFVSSGAGVSGLAAKRGLAAVLVLVQLAVILERCQPRLDRVEFRRSHGVLLASRQNGGNLVLDLGDTIRSGRMSRECLGQRAGLL